MVCSRSPQRLHVDSKGLQLLFVLTHLCAQSDVWSFGVVLYELFTRGQVPYGSFTNEEARLQILKGEKLSCPSADCPKEIEDLMESCFNDNPDHRPDFKSIFNVLRQHVTTDEKTATVLPNDDQEYYNTF